MKKIGKPSKLTPSTKDDLLNYIKNGLSHKDAAVLSGIGERTFYNWKTRGENEASGMYWQFLQDLKKAEVIGKALLIGEIRKDDSWQAKAWLLERRFPEEFGRNRIELGIDGNLDINIVIPKDDN